MYDGLDKIPVNKLNFEQLRERVQVLTDRYEALIRRMPWLTSMDNDTVVDWAYIVTPLINALVNKIIFTANQQSDGIIDADAPPPYPDKTRVYNYDGRYWYWDGLNWTGVDNRETLNSVFTQTPTAFQFDSMFYNIFSSLVRFVTTQTYIRGDEQTTPPPYPDKTRIYKYGKDNNNNDLYWYWNGNEWKSQTSPTVRSSFLQKPYGFSLDGVLEVLTDTGGGLTVSDSFIKMYPFDKDSGTRSDDPKIQFGYDDQSEHNNPIIILGVGSQPETVPIKGYPVRYGQGIIIKTADSVVIGMVSDYGIPNVFELRANGDVPWIYYNDGTADMKVAVDVDINSIGQQINAINSRLDDIDSEIAAL